MRNLVLVALLAGVVTIHAAESSKDTKSESLLRWSFIGTTELAKNKNLAAFNAVRALPAAAAFRDTASSNLAYIVASRYGARAASNGPVRAQLPRDRTGAGQPPPVAKGVAALLQPLLTDLVQNESRFQMDTAAADDAHWKLAVRLPESRVAVWNNHLAQLAALSRMTGAVHDKPTWTAARDQYKLSFSKAKDWTIIEGGSGAADFPASKSFRDSLNQRSDKTVLDAEINPPLLAKIWGAPQLAHYPKLSLQAEPKNDGFQSELVLNYPQDLGIKAEKWNVPTELIKEPLIGFTAIQGIQKKLESLPQWKALNAQQTPNQLFLWAQGISPFSIALAADVRNPAEVVTNAARAFQKQKLPVGDLQLATNRPALLWMGLPIAVPFLEAAADAHTTFLTAGLFPAKLPDPKPAPPELLAQLNSRNRIFYDWEITSERLGQLIPIWQLYYLIGGKFFGHNEAASSRLLQGLKPQLGNTTTAGSLENPNTIKFVRQSHLGLTATELVLLTHYLDPDDLRPLPATSALVPAAAP